MADLLIDAFLRQLAVQGQPGLAVTGEENYAALVEGGGKKLAIAKSRLPNFFVQGFNAMDMVHLQQLRHRLDTAIELVKKARQAGRTGIILADAWDPKMKVEEIKAAVDSVYAAGVPLEFDAIWAAESKNVPPRFTNITPNRPRSLGIPVKIAGAEGSHHDAAHEHGHAHEHDGEGGCCGS
jgi:hypothetical protein